MGFASLHIETVEQTAEVGDVEQVVLDRDRAASAVHRFFKLFLLRIISAVMPHHCRVRIRLLDVPLVSLQSFDSLVEDRGLAAIVFRIEHLGWAHVTTLGWVDAPEVADSFSVFRVFADCDVDQAIEYDRRGNQVIAS